MVDWLNACRGYVRIGVNGFSPERFMNLCSNKGIVLWDILKTDDGYEMCICLNSFFELRPIVRKTGTKVVVLERYGLPFLVPKLKRRKMFLAGALLAVTFWIWSTGLIWNIEYDGNYQITDETLERFLKENNVTVGMKKDHLNIEELEKEIRRAFPQITWTSIKLEGTKMQVELKENEVSAIVAMEETEGGSDLVADYGGRIVAMIVRQGVPKVAIGEEVEEGTVLVEGTVPIYNEDTTVREKHFVWADADIVMEHGRHFEEKLDVDYVKKEYTGRTEKRSFARFGEKEWKLPGDSSFLQYDSVIYEEQPLVFQKLSVPVYWGQYTHREYQNVEHIYTREEAECLLNEKLELFLSNLEEKGVQIIEKNVKIDTNGEIWTLEGDFLVEEQVGINVAITEQEESMGEKETDE